jgi:hypothetical protein
MVVLESLLPFILLTHYTTGLVDDKPYVLEMRGDSCGLCATLLPERFVSCKMRPTTARVDLLHVTGTEAPSKSFIIES